MNERITLVIGIINLIEGISTRPTIISHWIHSLIGALCLLIYIFKGE